MTLLNILLVMIALPLVATLIYGTVNFRHDQSGDIKSVKVKARNQRANQN